MESVASYRKSQGTLCGPATFGSSWSDRRCDGLFENAAEYDQQVGAPSHGHAWHRWFWPQRRARVVARFLRSGREVRRAGNTARTRTGRKNRRIRGRKSDRRTRHQSGKVESGDLLTPPKKIAIAQAGAAKA